MDSWLLQGRDAQQLLRSGCAASRQAAGGAHSARRVKGGYRVRNDAECHHDGYTVITGLFAVYVVGGVSVPPLRG